MEAILNMFGDIEEEIELARMSSNMLCTEFACGTLECSYSLMCIPY